VVAPAGDAAQEDASGQVEFGLRLNPATMAGIGAAMTAAAEGICREVLLWPVERSPLPGVALQRVS